jgi:hypothetical protein
MTYITITKRAFWTMKGVIFFFALSMAVLAGYFYGEHVKHICYLENRKEFIEQYRVVQMELRGETFVYEPRGGLIREATYKGNNLYRVK